jgi:hypothetical protein
MRVPALSPARPPRCLLAKRLDLPADRPRSALRAEIRNPAFADAGVDTNAGVLEQSVSENFNRLEAVIEADPGSLGRVLHFFQPRNITPLRVSARRMGADYCHIDSDTRFQFFKRFVVLAKEITLVAGPKASTTFQ